MGSLLAEYIRIVNSMASAAPSTNLKAGTPVVMAYYGRDSCRLFTPTLRFFWRQAIGSSRVELAISFLDSGWGGAMGFKVRYRDRLVAVGRTGVGASM